MEERVTKRERREKMVPAYNCHDINIVSGSLVLLKSVYIYSYFKYILFPSQLYEIVQKILKLLICNWIVAYFIFCISHPFLMIGISGSYFFCYVF